MFWLIFSFNYRFYFAKTGENGPAVNPSRQAKRQAQRLKGAVREQTGGRANRQDERLERLKRTVSKQTGRRAKQPEKTAQIALPDAVEDGAGSLPELNKKDLMNEILNRILADRGLGIPRSSEDFLIKDLRNWLLLPDNEQFVLAFLEKGVLSNQDFSEAFRKFGVDPSTLKPERLLDEILASPELTNTFAKIAAASQQLFGREVDSEAGAVAAGPKAGAGSTTEKHFRGVRRVKDRKGREAGEEVRKKRIVIPKSLAIGISGLVGACLMAFFSLSSKDEHVYVQAPYVRAAYAQVVPTVNLDPTAQPGNPGQEIPSPIPATIVVDDEPQMPPTVNTTVTPQSGDPGQATETPEPSPSPSPEPKITVTSTPTQVIATIEIPPTVNTTVTPQPGDPGQATETATARPPATATPTATTVTVTVTLTPTKTPEPPTKTPEPPTRTPEPPTRTPEPPTRTPEPEQEPIQTVTITVATPTGEKVVIQDIPVRPANLSGYLSESRGIALPEGIDGRAISIAALVVVLAVIGGVAISKTIRRR